MFRIVALIACRSHDYWLDVNDVDCIAEGPSRHAFLHLGTTNTFRDDDSTDDHIRTMRAQTLANFDEHAELHSFAVINQEQWANFRDLATWPVPSDVDALGTTSRPVIVNNLLTLDEAFAMWRASETTVVPGDRYGLAEEAPALFRHSATRDRGPSRLVSVRGQIVRQTKDP